MADRDPCWSRSTRSSAPGKRRRPIRCSRASSRAASHELFPDAICVIGAPEEGDGLVMEYFDSRGVRRTYGTSLEDGVLRIWRDHPGFDQRFSATIGGDAFDGLWQLAREPGDWHDDLAVSYRRRRT